ncbi:unnamed protein product, partial [marine sediment metagenome]
GLNSPLPHKVLGMKKTGSKKYQQKNEGGFP